MLLHYTGIAMLYLKKWLYSILLMQDVNLNHRTRTHIGIGVSFNKLLLELAFTVFSTFSDRPHNSQNGVCGGRFFFLNFTKRWYTIDLITDKVLHVFVDMHFYI